MKKKKNMRKIVIKWKFCTFVGTKKMRYSETICSSLIGPQGLTQPLYSFLET